MKAMTARIDDIADATALIVRGMIDEAMQRFSK